jgi:hypothetical protein
LNQHSTPYVLVCRAASAAAGLQVGRRQPLTGQSRGPEPWTCNRRLGRRQRARAAPATETAGRKLPRWRPLGQPRQLHRSCTAGTASPSARQPCQREEEKKGPGLGRQSFLSIPHSPDQREARAQAAVADRSPHTWAEHVLSCAASARASLRIMCSRYCHAQRAAAHFVHARHRCHAHIEAHCAHACHRKLCSQSCCVCRAVHCFLALNRASAHVPRDTRVLRTREAAHTPMHIVLTRVARIS